MKKGSVSRQTSDLEEIPKTYKKKGQQKLNLLRALRQAEMPQLRPSLPPC